MEGEFSLFAIGYAVPVFTRYLRVLLVRSMYVVEYFWTPYATPSQQVTATPRKEHLLCTSSALMDLALMGLAVPVADRSGLL